MLKNTKLKRPKSEKQANEFEGKEKHLWHQKKKRIEKLRIKELESDEIDPTLRDS